MQFEAGGQPPKGPDSPFPKVEFAERVPSDAAADTWFAYSYREGFPRMLDLGRRTFARGSTSPSPPCRIDYLADAMPY